MPCYKPLKARRDDGRIRFVARAELATLKLPCGRCIGCRLEHSRQWATRCMHEASLHRHNCFITLTYADEHLPEHGSLRKDHHQKFLKRLRKALGKRENFLTDSAESMPTDSSQGRSHAAPGENQNRLRRSYGAPPHTPSFRYYMAGEYGSQLARPHYHLCIFGLDFRDKRPWRKTAAGSQLYRSPTLERLWPYGHSTVGALTFESAAYTARYVMKKITGKEKQKHYERLDTSTGEIIQLQQEYNEMSRRTGIGLAWIQKYKSDVYDALPGQVIIRGKTATAPRYYNKQLEKWDAEKYELIQDTKRREGWQRARDNTPSRLAARERVAQAKLRQLKRNL